MKIISGKYKNTLLIGYDNKSTRATQARIRESIIAIIKPYLEDKIFLDLFSGTGSIAFEALSNGAKSIILNDNDRNAYNNLIINKKKFIDENIKIYNLDYKNLLNTMSNKVDIVYLDPPYNKYDYEEILKDIINSKILNKDALIIIESSKKLSLNYPLLKERKYGKKYIYIFMI